nr:hypothetical protein [Tanacetum cinerariifolium]
MVNATKESFDEDDLAKFQELLLDANKPLYKGCPNFTKLFTIVKLLNLKENNVSESLVGTLLNVPGKTKDGMNARLDLAELGIKLELFARQEEDKTTLPPAGRNRPEGCISEETIVEETIEFFSEYHKTMKTIGIPPNKHVTNENEDGKTLSAGKSSEVLVEVFQKAHLRHKQVLKTKNPGKRIALLENEHSKSFAKWLREEVERELAISKDSVSESVRWVSYGPHATIVKYEAYNINGYTFRTKSNDGIVYQNSRVSVEAVDLHISKEVATTRKAFYYGVLQEIWVLDYHFRQIPLFKCEWVNHKAGRVKHDPNLGYTLVDLNSLGHKDDPFILASQARQVFYVKDQIDKKLPIVFSTPTKNYKDTYDEVDEEFSTVIHEHNDNILPHVNRRDLGNESQNDYYRTDCEGCGPDICDIRTSYVNRQCTSYDGDNAAPCLLRRLAASYLLRRLTAPYLLRRLAAPYLLSRLAASYLLRRLAAPYLLRGLAASYLLRRLVSLYLMRRHYSLVISSGLKETKLETLIATYDIPLDLRPRPPDPNFRMINLPTKDTPIGIYSRIFDSSGVRIPFSSFLLAVLKYFKVHISQLVPLGLSKVITFEVDWISFAKHGDPAPMRMEVAKSRLKLWKEKFFLIDGRAIPFHMPWRHPDSCIIDKVMVRKEPHGLDTSILGWVADRTTLLALAGTAIPRASREEITVTRPDRKLDTTDRPFHSEQRIDLYSLNNVSVLPNNTANSINDDRTKRLYLRYLKNCISNDNEGRMIERNFVEIHGTFLVKIRNNTFNGAIGESMFEHINKFLEVVRPIKINEVSQDQFRLSIFLISLAGVADEWFKKDCIGSVTTWEDLVEKFIQKFYQLSDDNEEIEAKEDDDPDDITDIFKIEGNLFKYETPLCKAFNDFNCLIKIDRDLFTFDIQGIRTYEEYELDNLVTRDLGELVQILMGFVTVESYLGWFDMTYFQDHKWYDELADGKLKEETLMHKAKVEESWGNATPGVMKFYAWLINSFGNFHELDYNVLVKLQECWWKINAPEVAPFTRLESYGQRPYANIKTEKAHDPYLKVNNIIGISTNVAKKTRSSKKGFGVGSSGQATEDEVEKANDGTLDDDDQRDGSEFAMKSIESLNDVSQRPVFALSWYACLFINFCFKLYQDADDGGNGSDGNVDPYHEARVGFCSDSPPYTKDDWEEIHGVNLGLWKKELYKDPKVCRTALDRFPTPAETHRLRELTLVELSDRMSVLQCQLITHGSMLNARYDHSLKNVDRLTKRCSQQTQIIKKQNADIKQQSESIDRANEEVSRLTAQLGVLKSRVKIEEELVGTKSQSEHRERQPEEVQGSIASFFQSDFTSLVRRFLKTGVQGVIKIVDGFIPDAKEKFDRAVAAFPATTFLFLDQVSQNSQTSLQDIARLEPDRVMPPHQTFSATASLRPNTHGRHSTSSSRTFSHTSTLEPLKKKKFVEK